MLALIVMRYTKPNYPRPYKVPIIIPVVVLVISVYLVAAPIFDTPRIEYLYALLFIFAGLIFYVPFVKLGMTPRFMSKSLQNFSIVLISIFNFLFFPCNFRQGDTILSVAAGGCANIIDGHVRIIMFMCLNLQTIK